MDGWPNKECDSAAFAYQQHSLSPSPFCLNFNHLCGRSSKDFIVFWNAEAVVTWTVFLQSG